MSEFWGQLCAGLVLLPLYLIGEALLDEWRDRRHGK